MLAIRSIPKILSLHSHSILKQGRLGTNWKSAAPLFGQNRGFSTPSNEQLDLIYHKRADEYLENLVEYLEEIGDELDHDGYDVVYSSGVLTLSLGNSGTYVLNKQPPNRQIWLSSPTTGPKRFDYEEPIKQWVYERTGLKLNDLLNKELSDILKAPIVTPN
ncbi:hypothetical protein HDV02_006099 [Globomyces sp. JEL0801]|nr:hypothetical protein HDV02_006099 [Globomyces sp. JEL0801]